MKIILVSSLLIPRSIGGIEILTVLTAKALTKRGHQVTIYTGGPEKRRKEDGVMIREIKELVLPLHLKSFLMPFYSWRLRKRLEKEKDFLMADIINAVDLDSIVALAGWEKIKEKLVVTIQDYGLVCANGLLLYGQEICPNYCHQGKGFLCLNKRKISWLKKFYLQLAYSFRKQQRDKKIKRLNWGICVSHFVADKIKKYNSDLSIQVIGNCLPEEWWKIKSQREKEIDILYVGRLESFKGTGVALQALKEVLVKKQLKVIFVGTGRVEEYRQMAQKMGLTEKITFTGGVDFQKMRDFYQKAKVVLVPSVWPEPCGRVIIEGMFFGGVVISTNQGGTPELIIHGKNGLLVPPGNSGKLAQTILWLFNRPERIEKIVRYASSYAHQSFKQGSLALKYERFYRLVLNQKID